MIRVFKHYVPHAVLLLGLFDLILLLGAAELGWIIRAYQIDMDVTPVTERVGPIVSFGVALQLAVIAVGVYGAEALHSMRFASARLLVAISLGVMLLSFTFFIMPDLSLWRSHLLYAMGLSMVFLILNRLIFSGLLGGDAFQRRLLILGAGARAERIKALAQERSSGFDAVGFVSMNDGPSNLDEAVNRSDIANLSEHVVNLKVSEVVLALEERRNALPLADLLRVKTTGVYVNDYSSFLERETGRVDLGSVNPSWLIFSDGFSAGRRISTLAKRIFDIVASVTLLTLTAPIVALFAILIKLESKGPAFFRQTRVGLYGVPFSIIKLRSMREDAEVGGKAVWASENDPRVTRIGQFIRKVRIDELPQTWGVLMGQMSFVGPRPERPEFVKDLEQKMPYYAERHMVKPGITGWAQVNYPYGASIEDSRHKLEYDLYYAKNYTPFLDILILLQTLRVVLWSEGAR